MRIRTLLALCVLFGSPALAAAQSAQLELPAFDHLAAKAIESVDITIGAWPLGLAARFMGESDEESAELKRLLSGLQAIYVRSYEFDADFVYSKADIDAVRKQLSAPGWSQLVQVRDRKGSSDVDIYVAIAGDQAKGLAIVASDPRQFTILNIVGAIDVDKLADLESHFGLPELSGLTH